MKSFKLEKGNSNWSWKISEEDLKKQVENYDKLKIAESYRGISVLLGAFSIALTLLMMFFGYSDSSAIFDLVVLSILLFFVYRGHRWAIIALIIVWTLEKAVQVYILSQNGDSPILAIIWWFIFMPYFWKALRVENERKKLGKVQKSEEVGNASFCTNCGNPIEVGSKFCIKCGNKIT